MPMGGKNGREFSWPGSFRAKKQGFLVKSSKGVDQKAGMMTFERVMLCYMNSIKERRDGRFDVTSGNDSGI